MSSGSHPYLLISWQADTKALSVRPASSVGHLATPPLDATAMTEKLWAEYSTAVTQRFARVFPEAVLGTVNLPREVVELHLLVDIYRPHAFPALLAERLARQIIAHLNNQSQAGTGRRECEVTLSPLAGDCAQLVPALECELQLQLQRSRTNRAAASPTGTESFVAQLKSWVGAGAGVAVTTLNLFRLLFRRARCVSTRDVLPENIFVLFSGSGNHTRHLWKWLDSAAAPKHNAAILVLGQHALEAELLQRAAANGIRVFYFWCLADLPRALWKLLTNWGGLSRLTHRAAADLRWRCGISFHARAAAWWLRGWLHEAAAARLRLANPGTTIAHFGLVAHADSRLADLALRQHGIKTIHWLHGIVEDSLHYRANSTAGLCQNPVDADLRNAHGSYAHCLTPVQDLEATPRRPEPESAAGVLIVTNLLHPDNRFANAGAAEALRQLLQLVAAYFSGANIARLTWRPHPRENATPDFSAFQQLASGLGFTMDNDTPLAEQVRRHRQVIATFSGSIGDIAAAGTVPAVFAGLPYETAGHWGRLPTEIKFRTAAELTAVFNRFRSEPNVIHWRDQLCAQYNQPAPTAEAIRSAIEEVRAAKGKPQHDGAHFHREVASC